MYSILLFCLVPLVLCRMEDREEFTPPPPTVGEPLPSPIPPSPTSCFSAPRELCPTTSACRLIDQHSLLCCDIDTLKIGELYAFRSNNQSIKYIHIRNASLEELNANLSIWRSAESLSITDGHITRIQGDFPKLSIMSCLNISNNGLMDISPRSLSNLIKLNLLDMSDNHLTEIPNFPSTINISLNIRGNKILCKSVLDAMNKTSYPLKFIDANVTNCTSSKTFHWFNSTENVPLTQVEVIHELKNDCPESASGVKCKCKMVRLFIVPSKPTVFSVGVDCSNMNLKELPAKLPPNTIQLNVSNNNITSLAGIIKNPSYDNVRLLSADNNLISSIKELEGTKFIDNFDLLSLKGNQLKIIHTYVLSNSLNRPFFLVFHKLLLGNNYLTCDCSAAKVLKYWLYDKEQNIPDYNEIYCENTNDKVINLDENIICQQQKNWSHYIVYIIVLEAFLLTGLIAKVSYDYWIFKTVGYLPWPANKMPKLPCDWLCE